MPGKSHYVAQDALGLRGRVVDIGANQQKTATGLLLALLALLALLLRWRCCLDGAVA